MAQTFKVSKKPSPPGTRKHRGTLVVSAVSNTPITVTPLPLEGKNTHTKNPKMTKDNTRDSKNTLVKDPKKIKMTDTHTKDTREVKTDTKAPAVPPPSSAVLKRLRGRPRKVLAAGAAELSAAPPAAKASTRLKRTRPRRIDHGKLLEAERLSGKVPLAASRIVEQLQALLGRATVEAFRGKKDRPHVTLSKLEEQAIQEALVLFQLKVSLQRGGEVRRVKAS